MSRGIVLNLFFHNTYFKSNDYASLSTKNTLRSKTLIGRNNYFF